MVSRMPVAARGLGWAALQPLLLAKRCCEPDTLSSRCTHAGIGLSGQVGGAPEIQRSYTGREILAPAALDAPRPASTSSNCRLSAASDTSTATNPSPQRSREAFQRNRGAAPWRDCLRKQSSIAAGRWLRAAAPGRFGHSQPRQATRPAPRVAGRQKRALVLLGPRRSDLPRIRGNSN